MLGALNSAGWGINPVRLAPRWRYYAGFAQDDFKLTRNFTMNVGLRWELYLPFYDKFDNYSIMDPKVPNPAAGGIPGALIFAGDGPGRVGRRRLTEGLDTRAFSPRVGFAWSVKPKIVIRSSGALTYFPSYPYGTGNFRGIAQGFSTGASAGSPDGYAPAYYWDNPFPLQIPLPPFIDPGYLVGQGVSTYYPDSKLLSYVAQWNLGVQWNFAPNWMIDTAYVGNAGNRLLSGQSNPNQIDPKYLALGDLLNAPINDPAVVAAGFRPPYANFISSFPYVPTRGQALRPFPQYANVDYGPNNGPNTSGSAVTGHSTYHALQTKLSRQLSQGLFLLTAYTFSKKLTDADSSWGGFFSPGSRDTYNRQIEKALSPSNPTHRLTVAFNYELPIGPGKKLLQAGGAAGKLLGGWQVNGILTYQGGFPIVLNYFNSLPLANYKNLPDVVPGVNPILSSGSDFDPATDRYLNPAAFRAPAPFRFGNAPAVLAVRDFPLYDESIGIMKRTRITEQFGLQFRAEFFNLFNRVRFGPINSDFGTPGFGTVGGQQNGPRFVQFAMKLEF
jgi:hypothetical protein